MLKPLPFEDIETQPRMPTQRPGTIRYNNTQWYLLLTNSISGFLWVSVFLRLVILFPLVGTKFLPGGIADFFLSIQCLIFIDLFTYIKVFRLVDETVSPKPDISRLILTIIGRMIVSFGVLYRYPKVARNVFFSVWILSTSVQEFSRYIYNAYKVRTFGGSIFWLSLFKNASFMILFPLQICSEMSLIFVSLPFIDEQEPKFGYALRLVLLLYIVSFYSSYKAKIIKCWRKNSVKASRQKKQS